MFFVFFAITTISRKTLNNSNHISSSTFQFTLSKLLMVLYFVLPNVKIRKIRYVMPGTIFTTLVIGYLSNLFGTYVIRTLSRLVDIKLFGSIMIFVFMLWFIFLARILILGAVFNATYQELRQGELKSRRGDVITIIQSFSGDGSDSKKHKKHEDDS